jgi:lysozyme
MTRNIVDISHWDGNIDFQQVRASGIVAVVAKATTGGTGVDPQYARYKAGALAQGLLWGTFHFGTGDDVNAQVQNYLSTVTPNPRELAALDYEPNPYGSTMSLAQVRDFVGIFQSRTGRYPILYSGVSIKEALCSNMDPLLSRCPLWIAQYGPAVTIPPAWPRYTLWQYTDGTDGLDAVPGIGRCDRNQYDGSDMDLQNAWPLS